MCGVERVFVSSIVAMGKTHPKANISVDGLNKIRKSVNEKLKKKSWKLTMWTQANDWSIPIIMIRTWSIQERKKEECWSWGMRFSRLSPRLVPRVQLLRNRLEHAVIHVHYWKWTNVEHFKLKNKTLLLFFCCCFFFVVKNAFFDKKHTHTSFWNFLKPL